MERERAAEARMKGRFARVDHRPGGWLVLINPDGDNVIESRSRVLLERIAALRGWRI
jgi:hypothetical protein